MGDGVEEMKGGDNEFCMVMAYISGRGKGWRNGEALLFIGNDMLIYKSDASSFINVFHP